MKTKMKIWDWFKPRNWGWVKVYRDFENYFDWIKTVKREKANPDSNFNKWKLQHTRLYDIYVIISLEDIDVQLPAIVQRTKVVEMLNPLNRYLDNDLGFAECLNIELNQIDDDENKPTLSYLIVYRFNFVKFSLLWLAKFLIINSILLYLIFKFKLISLFISWI